jgi:transposase
MFEIKSVLERVGRGESRSEVERVTGHTRKTIGRYVKRAEALGWRPGAPVTDELAGAVARASGVARDRGPGDSEQLLLPHLERIRAWLTPSPEEKRGLRLAKVQQLLERQGVRVPYSSLHRFAVTHCGFQDRRRITVRLDDPPPGLYAQVDFGRLGLVPDADGRRRLLWGLSVVLPSSRHQFLFVTFSQRLEDLIEGLEDAWVFFGGVPALLVVDNLKAAVVKADRYEPLFNRSFEAYARHRGFAIDATRARDPKGKPHVERGIQYVRESFFRGEAWLGRDHVQREALRWCLETAGTRVHGTTRQRPLAVFENVEQAALQPLTGERYDPPAWSEHTVHPDHTVVVNKGTYTLPTRYIGTRVLVESTRALVRFYVGHELIRTRERVPAGGRCIDHRDYPSEQSAYTMRDPERLTQRGDEIGAATGAFMRALLAGPTPWAKLRQAQALLRLATKYGEHRVEEACERANAFDIRNTKRVEHILLQALAAPSDAAEPSTASDNATASTTRFARPNSSFKHDPKLDQDAA